MAEKRSVPRRPSILIILDGFGVNPSRINNAVAEANTPRLDEYFSKNTHITLDACGKAVGLPIGQMGNSEVGHLTLGCGSILKQDLVRIDDAIASGEFLQNAALVAAMDDAANNGRPMHLVGLVSDGGVHSHIAHVKGLVDATQDFGLNNVYIHAFTDGRDVDPKSGANYISDLKKYLQNTNAKKQALGF